MRWLFALGMVFCLGGPVFFSHAQEAAGPSTPEEGSIVELAGRFASAYNHHDAKTLAEMFTVDAEWVADDGRVTKGRAEIERLFRTTFSADKNRKLDLVVESTRLLTPEVLLANGVSTLVGEDGMSTSGSYSAVHLRQDGHWLIAQLTETGGSPEDAATELQALAWLVGAWVEKSPGVEVREKVEWTANKKFLTRSYTFKRTDTETAQGTEVIGWDPTSRKVRSWAFDSDGGFSESTWTRDGDRWLILVKATLPDGRQGSAQHTLTHVDDNRHTWSSANRQVAGELLPNIDPIEIVRSK